MIVDGNSSASASIVDVVVVFITVSWLSDIVVTVPIVVVISYKLSTFVTEASTSFIIVVVIGIFSWVTSLHLIIFNCNINKICIINNKSVRKSFLFI